MVFWWLIEILFTLTLLHFLSIEIPDYAQISDELYSFSRTFLAKEPIHNLTLYYFYYFCCKLFAKYWVAETFSLNGFFQKT